MIIWIIIFLILSALFSGSEIAFVSANRLSIQVRDDAQSRSGRILSSFYSDPSDFLGTMLVGNNIALVAFTTLLASLLTPALERSIGSSFLLLMVLTLITTVIVLIFGEYLPKTIFRNYSTSILYALAVPLAILRFILLIPTRITTRLSSWIITKVLRVEMDDSQDDFTRTDLELFIDESISDEDGAVNSELLKKAIHFEQVKVRDCMVPRTEICYVDMEDSIEDLISEFEKTKKSRLLVVDEDIDDVKGYVHHLKILRQPKSLRRQIIDLPIVTEYMPVNDLLVTFIKDRIGIACVVDEFGSTSGIITMEDILEEIFGEIEDEHDVEDLLEMHISDMEYLLSGRHELDYLQEKYENLRFTEGDYHTLSGYLVMTSGKIPEQGEEIELDGYKFIIEAVTEKKIDRIRVIVSSETDAMNTDGSVN